MRSLLLMITFASACLSAGCSILPKSAPQTRYVLGDAGCTQAAQRKSGARLLVLPTTANAYLDSQRIIYAEQTQTRSAYKLSSWVESPAARVAVLLRQRLECSGQFSSVTQSNISAQADYMLSTEVLEMVHDLSVSPAEVRMSVRAELFDARTKAIAGSNTFSSVSATTELGPQAAVQKFNQATDKLLSAIVDWTADRISGSRPGREVQNGE